MDGEPAPPRRNGQQPPGSEEKTTEPAGHRPLRLIKRTATKAFNDGIFGHSAQTAFWQALSLPPLLLGLLGTFRIVAGWFGSDAVDSVQREIIDFSDRIFTDEVVEQIIEPTVRDVLYEGRNSIISVGFILSLWAGSSALASLVDAITKAHSQHKVRHPVWQRIFALLLYLASLTGALVVLPLAALGPDAVPEFFNESSQDDVERITRILYYPVLGFLLVVGLATLYKVVLPRKLPWRRGLPGALLAMVVFMVASVVLRQYIQWLNRSGYTYGALATPIAFLLISFFIAFAIILGAQFNNAIDEMWPVQPSRRERRRWRRLEMDRRTRRDQERRSAQRWAPDQPTATTDLNRPVDAPSPADVQPTIELHRNGSAEPPPGHSSDTHGDPDAPNRIVYPDEPPQSARRN